MKIYGVAVLSLPGRLAASSEQLDYVEDVDSRPPYLGTNHNEY